MIADVISIHICAVLIHLEIGMLNFQLIPRNGADFSTAYSSKCHIHPMANNADDY